jgi:hypothetical protein
MAKKKGRRKMSEKEEGRKKNEGEKSIGKKKK